MKYLLLFSILLLTGCSTIYPHNVIPEQPAPDSSTPIEYDQFSSGYLGKVVLRDGKTYNAMTQNWHVKHNVPATEFTDRYGNKLWAVSDEALTNWYKSTLNP